MRGIVATPHCLEQHLLGHLEVWLRLLRGVLLVVGLREGWSLNPIDVDDINCEVYCLVTKEVCNLSLDEELLVWVVYELVQLNHMRLEESRSLRLLS